MTVDTTNGVHTTTDPDGTGWVNQTNGEILSRHHKKANAIAKGRQTAKRHGVLYSVHRRDGVVIETQAYAKPAL